MGVQDAGLLGRRCNHARLEVRRLLLPSLGKQRSRQPGMVYTRAILVGAYPAVVRRDVVARPARYLVRTVPARPRPCSCFALSPLRLRPPRLARALPRVRHGSRPYAFIVLNSDSSVGCLPLSRWRVPFSVLLMAG